MSDSRVFRWLRRSSRAVVAASPSAAVLLPLYIYPLPGAWDRLYAVLSAYPNVSFTVVINPHDGPGEGQHPGEDYAREIPKLNSLANVYTVGYVRIGYCKRDLAQVRQDMAKYAGWSEHYDSTGMAVHGIFLDETPNQYSGVTASYLGSVQQEIKLAPGILGERLMIHNPGTVPDAGLELPGPDVSAVVEESFAAYRSAALQKRLRTLQHGRDRYAYIVHSVPREQIAALVLELRARGTHVFVTDLSADYYCSFGPGWEEFVKAMAEQ